MSYYDNDDFEEYDSYEEDEKNNVVDDVSDIYDDYRNIKERINSKDNVSTNNSQKGHQENSNKPNKAAEGTNNGSTKAANTASNGTKAADATDKGAKAADTANKSAKAADAADKGAKAANAADKGAKAAKAGKTAATAGKAAATTGEAAAGPVGWVLLGADILLSGIRKRRKKRKEEKADPEKKRKGDIKRAKFAVLLASPFLLPIGLIFICGFALTIAQNVTTVNSTNRVNDYVECMQSNEKCQDVGEFKLDDEKQGFNKPLIALNYAELRELAQGYTDFSNKYFKNGEGVFNSDRDSIEKAFGIEGANILTKEKLDMVMLVNCFSIEARAFSKINWVEVWLDRETGELKEKLLDKNSKDDFDTIYETENDNSENSDIVQYFNWFNSENYAIKIPNVEKYSQSKSTIDTSVISETLDGTVTDTNIIAGIDASEPDGSNERITYSPGNIANYSEKQKEELRLSELRRYYEMVKDYLPRWYEIYAFYLNTGNMETTKDFYNSYLSEFGNITIKLLKIDDKYDTEKKTVAYRTITTEKDGEDEPKVENKTVVTVVKETHHNEGYSVRVVKGANAWYSRLLDRDARLEFTKEKVKVTGKNQRAYESGQKYTLDTDEDGNDDTTVTVETTNKIQLYSKTITYGSEPKRGIREPSCGDTEDEDDEEAIAAREREIDNLIADYYEKSADGSDPYIGTPFEGGPFAGTSLEGAAPDAVGEEYDAVRRAFFGEILRTQEEEVCLGDIVQKYHDYIEPYHKYQNDYLEIRFTAAVKYFYEVNEKEFNISDISAALEVVLQYYKDDRSNKKKISTVSLPSGLGGEDDPNVTSDVYHGWALKHTTSTGITYRSYKQDQQGSYYANLDYYVGSEYCGTFGSWGCPITSAAIMLDMLGIHIDPYELYGVVGAQTPDNAINSYVGKNLYTVSLEPSKEKIIECVQQGYPVGIHVGYNHNSHNQHYMVITDYDAKTGKFYVEGVHTAYETGWLSYEDIKEKNTAQGIDMIFIPAGL